MVERFCIFVVDIPSLPDILRRRCRGKASEAGGETATAGARRMFFESCIGRESVGRRGPSGGVGSREKKCGA